MEVFVVRVEDGDDAWYVSGVYTSIDRAEDAIKSVPLRAGSYRIDVCELDAPLE